MKWEQVGLDGVFPEKKMSVDEEKLLSLLSDTYWSTGGYISTVMGISEASLRRLVHSLRMRGNCILSGDNGYKLAANKKEVEHTIAHLKSRRKKIDEVLRAMERNAEAM